jgi:hypothetical protein
LTQRNLGHGDAPAKAAEATSLNLRVWSWPSLALRKDILVCAARSEMALGVFGEADFVRTIAGRTTRANCHDLQPTLRIEAIDTQVLGRRISLPCHI